MSEVTQNSDSAAERARLLVVDAEEGIVLMMSEALRLEGYDVDVAASASAAASHLGRREYDLVLLDLSIAESDRISLLEELRTRSPLAIAIVTTSFVALEGAIAALRQEAYDYLTKPCSLEELKHTVRRGIEHRRLMLAERAARAGFGDLNRELERRVEERTAELQRANQELTEANRAKDLFLAKLSHELRTPLTPMLGWVNMLRRRGWQGADAEFMTQGLDAIERNVRLQARLVDDLFDISRIISGKLRIEWEPVKLRAFVESAIESVRADADARGVAVAVELPDYAIIVQGAPLRLQQIVRNILSNAVKFTAREGSVSLRAWREGNEARIEITDNGVGIEPEFLPHIFDRFGQAEETTARASGDLGLGLAIVRALVELHGGGVRAESEGQGRGARFTLALPCAVAAHEREEKKPDDAATCKTVRVLVVDDSSETVELLQMLFARRGYEVAGAGSAEEALARACEKPPGIIISDIGLPEMDGYALLSRLRRLPGLEAVPAIALTGYASDEDHERAVAAGFAIHLSKPVDPDELLRVVRQLTD